MKRSTPFPTSSYSLAPTRPRVGWTAAASTSTRRASSERAPTWDRTGVPCWRWRPALRGSSPLATSAPVRSSVWGRRSGRARQWSPSCTLSSPGAVPLLLAEGAEPLKRSAVSFHELLAAVDVICRAGERGVGHDVNGEGSNVRRCDDAPDWQLRAELVPAGVELVAEERR